MKYFKIKTSILDNIILNLEPQKVEHILSKAGVQMYQRVRDCHSTLAWYGIDTNINETKHWLYEILEDSKEECYQAALRCLLKTDNVKSFICEGNVYFIIFKNLAEYANFNNYGNFEKDVDSNELLFVDVDKLNVKMSYITD